MPRPPRLHAAGGYYHVVLRGNHREALFNASDDREVLNEIVMDALQRFDARLHAYCWMTNHLHALMQIGNSPLGKVMQRIAMRYSRYRHRRLRTSGHLFERRYRARLVEVDAYFLAVLRYIHRNPAEAGIVRDPADYPWSSHRAYRQFMNLSDDEDIEHAAQSGDARILGSESLVENFVPMPRGPCSALTLSQLAEAVCAANGVSVEMIQSRSCARYLTPIRVELLLKAIEQRVARLTQVAYFLNRDPSALSKLLNQHHAARRR